MKFGIVLVAATTVAILTSGCASGSTGSASSSASSASSTAMSSTPTSKRPSPSDAVMTATDLATKIKAANIRVQKVVTITAASDPNHLLGRPTGYTSAAVLYLQGATCQISDPGTDCGATVEVWTSAADAAQRVTYIQGILKKVPALGSEYDYVKGPAVLRVTGKFTPEQAQKVNTAFGGQLQVS